MVGVAELPTNAVRPDVVIALHCSGACGGQWDRLGEALGAGYELIAPDQYGCANAGPWTGEHAFTLADEAGKIIALVDRADRAVHLVGHSYGGGVALHVAIARPDRIQSLVLYEPSAFHLLKTIDDGGAEALAEIVAIAREAGDGAITGDYRRAMACFVDYWNGPGAWDALRPELRAALTRWAPKAPLDFAALIGETTPPSAYARLRCPVLVLRGEHAPRPARLVAEALPALLPAARLAVVSGAGHMGPLTHPEAVNALIVRQIADARACAATLPKSAVAPAAGSLPTPDEWRTNNAMP